MSEIVRPNNPYARPIHATRPEGQMLQGEYYGEHATDKTLAGHHGRKVSPANRFVGNATAVPVDMDAVVVPTKSKERKVRERQAAAPTSPKTDATSPSDEQVPSITEDDLFG